MQTKYNHVVLEGYPDGTTWTHTYLSQELALQGMEQLKAAHKGREYVYIDMTVDK